MLESLVNALKTYWSPELTGHFLYLTLGTAFLVWKLLTVKSYAESIGYKGLGCGAIVGSCCTAMIYNPVMIPMYLVICGLVLIYVWIDVGN